MKNPAGYAGQVGDAAKIKILKLKLVLARAKEAGRTDVVAPNTNEGYRNEKGQIVAVPGFVK